MKTILREDKSGVSEVIGTILILGMTVVLFSTIIIWVSNIPTPTSQTRLDMQSTMNPVNTGPFPSGVNITIRHLGGDSLGPTFTRIYVSSQRGTNPIRTDRVLLHPYSLGVTPSGLIDGTNSVWEAGERWSYKNFTLDASDSISVTIVDLTKSAVVWTAAITTAAGSRPPVFVDKWADGVPSTSGVDPVSEHLGFALYAKVVDPDGDLNPNSVYATLSTWFGTGNACEQPQKMYDDGPAGGHGDRVLGDGIFTYVGTCDSAPFPNLNWDGTIILLNATDMRGNVGTSRIVLQVQPTTPGGGSGTPPSFWQSIGFVQVIPNGFWATTMNTAYNSATTFLPYRATRAQFNNPPSNSGPMFHLKLANHGNRTVFFDAYTSITFAVVTGGPAPGSIFVVKPVDPNKAANAGGVVAYPGLATNPANFSYAQVVDINPSDPSIGGLPTEIYLAARTPFTNQWPWPSPALNVGTYTITVIVSGMVGPASMTYGQIITRWGSTYNPYTHLSDVDPTTRTMWYSQLIEYASITVYT